MLIKLKSCPFCGGKTVFHGKPWVDIVCLSCSMVFSYNGCNSLSSAAEIFNSRVSSSEEYLFLFEDDAICTIPPP